MRAAKFKVQAEVIERMLGLPSSSLIGAEAGKINGAGCVVMIVTHPDLPECTDPSNALWCNPTFERSVDGVPFCTGWHVEAPFGAEEADSELLKKLQDK